MNVKPKEPILNYTSRDGIIKKLAKINGVTDVDEFLNPTEKSLHDPLLMSNIVTARYRIIEAIDNGENISIFADVDADGMCSTAITYDFLKKFTNKVKYFHKQRSDGHGIKTAVDDVPENTDLLIIVDSSTSDAEACKIISDKGIDIIILDHHPAENENPYAIIVNPQLEGDRYPNKDISGAGVCWKMCQVIDDYYGTMWSMYLVDLAGIGIHGDSMDMMNPENRYIVSLALEGICNVGLKALMEHRNKPVFGLRSNDIGYTIVPMLNATSRMDRIEVALELLTSENEKRCKELVLEMDELNEQRKQKQELMVAKFKEQVNEDDKMLFVIDHKNELGKGFTGLIAGDFSNMYQRPVVVVATEDGETYQGSFRSYGQFPLNSFLRTVDEITFVAGHEGAGGVGFLVDTLDQVKKSVNENLSNQEFDSATLYDLEISTKHITRKFIQDVENFTRINGKNIKEVKFLISDLFVQEKGKGLLGKKKDTMKIKCEGIDLMKFKVNKEYHNDFPVLRNIKAIGTLNLNTYYNKFKKTTTITNQMFMEEYQEV